MAEKIFTVREWFIQILKVIETETSLKEFDIVSFSLQYEQDYFNVLKMLNKRWNTS